MIALKFLQIHEQYGQSFFEQHLAYELDLFLKSGLREEYQRELRLF